MDTRDTGGQAKSAIASLGQQTDRSRDILPPARSSAKVGDIRAPEASIGGRNGLDLATLIGFIASVGLFAWALINGTGGNLGGFWDTPSVIIVIGGGISTTLLSVRLERFLSFIKVVRNAFFNKIQPADFLIRKLVSLSEVARREGILALQSQIEEIDNKFVANGLQMIVDGTDAETVKTLMQYEMDSIDMRHTEGKQVIDLLGKYGPAYGMIGTLVGLVIMLQNMDDPKKIGPGMAVAILTTLYGAIIANMICLPLSDKLNNRHSQEMLALTIAQAGILGIQAGDNPRVLEMKLAAFLDPRRRADLSEKK